MIQMRPARWRSARGPLLALPEVQSPARGPQNTDPVWPEREKSSERREPPPQPVRIQCGQGPLTCNHYIGGFGLALSPQQRITSASIFDLNYLLQFGIVFHQRLGGPDFFPVQQVP